MKKEPKIFTIGSCFAREIRRFLTRDGYDVYPKIRGDILTYYNTWSIRYEFERPKNLEADFYQNSDGQWQNPFRRILLAPTREALIEKTNALNEKMDEWIRSSDVFIITLGMSEVFRSKTSGLVYSNHPQYGLKKQCGQDCRAGVQGEFYNATVQDNYENLKRVVEMVAPRKVIFTVSPVPLSKSFTDLPTAEANLISKMKLREAVGLLKGVDYFDSFEYATGRMKTENIYKRDGRHVKSRVVQDIVARFHSRHFF